MRFTVRQKIQLPIIVFIAFLSLFAFLYFPYVLRKTLEDSFSNEVQSLARMAAHGITTGLNNDDFTSIRSALDFVKTSPSVQFVALVSNGETIASYPDGFEYSPSLKEVDTLLISDYPVTSYVIPGRVYIGSSKTEIKKLVARIRLTTTWVSLITLLAGIFFGIWQARLIVRPLRLLQLAAIKVGQGNLNTIVTRQTNDEIGDLASEFGKMVLNVRQAHVKEEEANKELQLKNEVIESERERLEVTLHNLQETQAHLVNAEKMAALGHLIAGIAHEVNTPLGAIRASINNIEKAITQTLIELPDVLMRLEPEQKSLFFEMVSDSLSRTPSLSAKEERQKKKALIKNLQQNAFEKSDEIAEAFVDMGMFNDYQKYELLLRADNVLEVLNVASRLALQQRNARNINIAVERASKIVFALKNYSRHDTSGRKIRVNITDGIDTILTLYHNQLKHGIDVIRSYEPLPDIPCYPDELNQVWTNLIHNAIQAMQGKGTLEIRVGLDNKFAVVEVIDTGKGIPEEIKAKIFEPFFTTKAAGEGTGLGLDIVRQIVTKHDGTISVTSENGKTVFTISIPAFSENEVL